jgi:hypothetical protein
MWDDERFVALSFEAKLVWLCILTGPQTTALPGLSSCGLATLSEVSRYGIDTVSKAIAELSAAGMVLFNPTCRVLSVPNAPKYNPCANAKVLTGWFSLWKNIPECAEKYNHIARLRASIEPVQPWSEAAWATTFGRVSVPSRYGIDTVSISGTVSVSGTVPPTGVQGGSTLSLATDTITASASGDTPSAVNPAAKAPSSPRRARKAVAPTEDTIPLPGTPARGIYDALTADPVLRPITAGPGEFAGRIADPDTYPGVNVLAEVKRAALYASEHPGKYTDGRRFLTNWLVRKAEDAARAPKPAAVAPTTPRPARSDAEMRALSPFADMKARLDARDSRR